MQCKSADTSSELQASVIVSEVDAVVAHLHCDVPCCHVRHHTLDRAAAAAPDTGVLEEKEKEEEQQLTHCI